MKRHENVLFVTTQKAWLSKDGTNIVVRVDKKDCFRAPIHTIGQVVCFGNVTCSPFLMGMCGENGVGLSFHTEQGRFLSRAVGRQSGNVLLRRAQHERSSNPQTAAHAARNFILAKLANCRSILQRSLRDHPQDTDAVTHAVRYLASLISETEKLECLERIRGAEGDAARVYFGVFNELVSSQKDDFVFTTRSRRPPLDNINALLSFIYTLLANDVKSACESMGLDPQMGFLHADRPGRASLSLDLMEELRPFLADRLALSLINRRQVQAKGFTRQESGAVHMDDNTRRTVIQAYQKRKEEELLHPFLGEKITVGLIPFIQARLFSRWLRDDLDAYPPFFVK